MPVNMGKEGDGGFEGLTGNFRARPSTISDKLVEGKDGLSDALRVTFEIEGKDDKLSLFVPLNENAAEVLRPFIPSVPDNVPADEIGMRSYLAANMPGDTFLVYASNSSVRGVTAAPGKQRVRLAGLHQFSRQSDGQRRVRFFAETKAHETVTWTVRYPDIVARAGKTPEQDDIGPAKEFSPNPYIFEYAIQFGLDWEQFSREVMDAYEEGRLFTRLGLDGEILGYFSDPNDITEELFQATRRHDPNRWCDVEIVNNEQYGIGPKRGDYSRIKFTPIIVEGAQQPTDGAEFQREVTVFLELWDNLVKVISGRGDERFMVGGRFTDYGRTVAVAVLKPLVLAYPDAIKQPEVIMPPTADTWTVDGLVCANFTAERLMGLDESTRFDIVDLGDRTGKKVLAWAIEAVPEWATIGQDTEAEVL